MNYTMMHGSTNIKYVGYGLQHYVVTNWMVVIPLCFRYQHLGIFSLTQLLVHYGAAASFGPYLHWHQAVV